MKTKFKYKEVKLPYANMQWDEILRLAKSAEKPDTFGLREEFIDLLKIAKSLSSEQKKS